MQAKNKDHNLKLLVVTHFFPSHSGGIQIVAGQLVNQLLLLDPLINIEWFASNCSAPPPKVLRFRARSMRTNNVVEAKMGIPCPLWSPFELGKLWRAVRRCDIVHLHDFAYFGNVCTAIFCRLQGKKYFVTQHIGVIPFKKAWMRYLLEYLNQTIGKWMLSNAELVVFVSEEVHNYFLPLLKTTETKLIANGVDESIFSPVYGEERQKLNESVRHQSGIENDHKIALFVGRFVEKKGVLLLLELAKSIPDINWIFAGFGPLEPTEKMANLRVVKGKKGHEIGDLMRVADLFVLPSRGEGFPLVVQEALACGTAVVVEKSLQTALPDVAAYLNVESLGEDDDLERWQAKVRSLIQENQEPSRAVRARFASETWSWQKCGTMYLEIINRLCSREELSK